MLTQVTTVLVVDDHPVVGDGLRLLLDRDPALQLAGYARTAVDARRQAQRLEPDMVLLDLRLPDTPCPELVSQLRAIVPTVRILIFTAHADEVLLQAALDAGAVGCLLKDISGTDVLAVLRRVAAGETYMDPRMGTDSDVVPRPAGGPSLTDREYQVLRHVAAGSSNPEIAEELGLARNTVKAYLQSVMQKLGAHNRVEAIIKASEHGLL